MDVAGGAAAHGHDERLRRAQRAVARGSDRELRQRRGGGLFPTLDREVQPARVGRCGGDAVAVGPGDCAGAAGQEQRRHGDRIANRAAEPLECQATGPGDGRGADAVARRLPRQQRAPIRAERDAYARRQVIGRTVPVPQAVAVARGVLWPLVALDQHGGVECSHAVAQHGGDRTARPTGLPGDDRAALSAQRQLDVVVGLCRGDRREAHEVRARRALQQDEPVLRGRRQQRTPIGAGHELVIATELVECEQPPRRAERAARSRGDNTQGRSIGDRHQRLAVAADRRVDGSVAVDRAEHLRRTEPGARGSADRVRRDGWPRLALLPRHDRLTARGDRSLEVARLARRDRHRRSPSAARFAQRDPESARHPGRQHAGAARVGGRDRAAADLAEREGRDRHESVQARLQDLGAAGDPTRQLSGRTRRLQAGGGTAHGPERQFPEGRRERGARQREQQRRGQQRAPHRRTRSFVSLKPQ